MEQRRWWVYDRPFLHDWMFGLGVSLGVVLALRVLVSDHTAESIGLLFQLVWAVVGGLFWTGVVVGSGREYVRARRGAVSGGAGALPS
jgi:hypothetical protein